MPKPIAYGSRLIVRKQEPLNAEPPLDLLISSFVTPAEAFYVRTHGTMPELDTSKHRVRVCGLVSRELELGLEDLRRDFEPHVITATLECAGNRRDELSFVDEVEGTAWRQGAIGTAVWRGTRLADVLLQAGCNGDDLHVAFEGADEVQKEGKRINFGGSIPLSKAKSREVLLAYEMNGTALAREHGHPIRLVVPGYIGARSVKWLQTISVQKEPSSNFFQQKAYKLLPDDMDQSNLDWHAGLMLGELPVNSVICIPSDHSRLASRDVNVVGYAISSGGRSIDRVEVSGDDGRSWKIAELKSSQHWSWTIWHAQLELPPGEHEIVVRAWDSAAQTQPARLEDIWNFKGYVNNAWHRTKVTVAGP